MRTQALRLFNLKLQSASTHFGAKYFNLRVINMLKFSQTPRAARPWKKGTGVTLLGWLVPEPSTKVPSTVTRHLQSVCVRRTSWHWRCAVALAFGSISSPCQGVCIGTSCIRIACLCAVSYYHCSDKALQMSGGRLKQKILRLARFLPHDIADGPVCVHVDAFACPKVWLSTCRRIP